MHVIQRYETRLEITFFSFPRSTKCPCQMLTSPLWAYCSILLCRELRVVWFLFGHTAPVLLLVAIFTLYFCCEATLSLFLVINYSINERVKKKKELRYRIVAGDNV